MRTVTMNNDSIYVYIKINIIISVGPGRLISQNFSVSLSGLSLRWG